MPKHSSRGTHSSSDDGAEKVQKDKTLESHTPPLFLILDYTVDIKTIPTVRLCFSLPVIVFRHQLEGLRAAVGVHASA